jgi:hypothetical protein
MLALPRQRQAMDVDASERVWMLWSERFLSCFHPMRWILWFAVCPLLYRMGLGNWQQIPELTHWVMACEGFYIGFMAYKGFYIGFRGL